MLKVLVILAVVATLSACDFSDDVPRYRAFRISDRNYVVIDTHTGQTKDCLANYSAHEGPFCSEFGK